MFDYQDNLEQISFNFNEMGNNLIYMKEAITDYSEVQMPKINFNFCHIAISKNGGLIAICKKKGFIDCQKGNLLSKNVLIMFQDGKERIYIPTPEISGDKRSIACLDFTQKDELYGILNDGGIYKFNYLEKKIKEKVTSQVLKEEGVVNAKFFEKGFIAVTQFPNFYYIKDIKNPMAILMTSMSSLVKMSPNVDFLAIPGDNSSSGKIELLIINENEKGGVFQIKLNEGGQNLQVNCSEDNNYQQIVGTSIIIREKPVDFYIPNSVSQINEKDKKGKNKDKKKDKNKDPLPPMPKQDEGVQNEIGKINALAISPSGEKIAFYNSEKKTAFLYDSNFNGKYEEVYFKYDESELSSGFEKQEINDALDYKEGCQFLFCGEETLALSRQRFIILSNSKSKNSLIYNISEEEEAGASEIKNNILFTKCIQEIDGIRYLTNGGVFMITQVPQELKEICDPFLKNPSKKLIDFYHSILSRSYKPENDLRSLSSDIAKCVEKLQLASAHMFWTENNNNGNKKELQLFILKAAQYIKKYTNKEQFNFDKFYERCKDIRIINSLRNDERDPIFITFTEYDSIDPNDIINRLLKYKNFKMAATMSRFLGYPIKRIIYKYVSALMKREIKYIESSLEDEPSKAKGKDGKEAEDENMKMMKEKYEVLFDKLEKYPGISYIKLAKKAKKYGGEKLAMLLLEKEKSPLIKIPQMLQSNNNNDKENKVYFDTLKLALETYDFNAVVKVFKKIEKDNKFFEIINNPSMTKIFPIVLLYLKKFNKGEYDNLFGIKKEEINKKNDKKEKKEILGSKDNFSPELYKNRFYIEKVYESLRILFKNQKGDERKNILEYCKFVNKQTEEDKNYDRKSMKDYIKNMEFAHEFKIVADKKKNLIHYTETEPYSVSIYDLFKSGIKKGEENFIESENKNLKYSAKKLYLLKIRTYLEMKEPQKVIALLEKIPIKKMGVTHLQLGEIYYEYKYYDKAAENLVLEKDHYYLSYMLDLLKEMNKNKEALEIVIKSKNEINKPAIINDILKREPRHKNFVDDLCAKYKVNLQ